MGNNNITQLLHKMNGVIKTSDGKHKDVATKYLNLALNRLVKVIDNKNLDFVIGALKALDRTWESKFGAPFHG